MGLPNDQLWAIASENGTFLFCGTFTTAREAKDNFCRNTTKSWREFHAEGMRVVRVGIIKKEEEHGKARKRSG